jgi:hypothetical protein
VFADVSVWLRHVNAQTESIDIIDLRKQEVGA